MPMPGPDMVRIRSSRVGWGEVRTDGTLGYDGGCCPIPLCRTDLRDALLISAHAPSRLEIDTVEPVEVFGVLNASARFDPRNTTEFWADWNFVGEVTTPGVATASLRLQPGRHLLVITCGSLDSRHTLWAIRKAPAVTTNALSVLTIAAYAEEQVPTELAVLARSARKNGVELKVCCVGERYTCHAEMKTARLLPVVEAIETPLVAYVDARDCMFIAGVDRMAEQFAGMQTPVVVSAEAQSWPIHDPEWVERFPKHPTGCNWLNAGQWMGQRAAILHALRVLAELPERAKRERSDATFALCQRAWWDDQILWQVAWLSGLLKLELDYEGRIFRNINTLDTTLVDNRDFDLADGVVFKASGQRPSVLHFSGSAAHHCMHQWGGLLGAF
jgi:hypothetical protein